MKFSTLIFLCFVLLGCKKEKAEVEKPPLVKIKIDYLGTGGYYNDDIESVPNTLTLGTNGPYTITSGKTYNIYYKADNSFSEGKVQVALSNINNQQTTFVINCYREGSQAYIRTYRE